MIESERLAPCAAGPVTAVGPEHEDRRRRGESSPSRFVSGGATPAGTRPLRLRDAVRDGEVAADAPGDEQDEQKHQAEGDPAADPAPLGAGPAGAPAPAGPAWSGRIRVVSRERDAPLGPAAPIDPVRLVLSGHEAGVW